MNKNIITENIPIIPLARLNKNQENNMLKNNKNISKIFNNTKINIFTDIKIPVTNINKNNNKRYIIMDSIDILRATPVNVKKGRKSFNDQLQIDTLISIPLSLS